MKIDVILNQIYQLPECSANRLKSHISFVTYPKGHILVQAGTIERKIYFIKTGIVRAFSAHEERDITFWFGEEGETVISMKGYVENKRGYENMELLEDCELYVLDIANLQSLYLEDIQIANWGRKFAELELLKIEERLISRELLEATQRYKELLAHYPSLMRRVPLKYIASYLGITQVSLSRIRKSI